MMIQLIEHKLQVCAIAETFDTRKEASAFGPTYILVPDNPRVDIFLIYNRIDAFLRRYSNDSYTMLA